MDMFRNGRYYLFIAFIIASSEGEGLFLSNATADMIMPDAQ